MRGRSSWIVVITEKQRQRLDQLAKHRVASGFHYYHGFVFAHLIDSMHERVFFGLPHQRLMLRIYICIYTTRSKRINTHVCLRVRQKFYKLSPCLGSRTNERTNEHVSLDESGRRAQTRLRRLLRPVSQQ